MGVPGCPYRSSVLRSHNFLGAPGSAVSSRSVFGPLNGAIPELRPTEFGRRATEGCGVRKDAVSVVDCAFGVTTVLCLDPDERIRFRGVPEEASRSSWHATDRDGIRQGESGDLGHDFATSIAYCHILRKTPGWYQP